MSSYLTARAEETPRYEGAPTTTPYRLSSVRHYWPIISGRIAADPQYLDRGDELRGNLSPTARIVEAMAPAGSVTVRPYLSTIVPLLDRTGLVMTGTQGDGANEVETITNSGTTSGGTYDLAIGPIAGVAIAVDDIPYDATAAEVQLLVDMRIRRLSDPRLRIGDIVVGGGPLPTTPMTITWQGQYAATNVTATVCEDAALTGSTPAYTLTTSTPGSVGTVLLPDGRGLPPNAWRWQSAKATGSTARTFDIYAVYDDNTAFERGQGFAVSQLAMGDDGQLSASLTGLVALGADDPGLTPSYDAAGVHPMLTRDLVVTWASGSGNVSGLSWSLENPVEAFKNHGIRSPYPGKLRYGSGVVTLTGTVTMDEYDADDRDRLLEGGTFDAEAHWRSGSKIGSTGALYELYLEMPACQVVGGQGAADLTNSRNHGASFDYLASYDVSATHDLRFTCVTGVSAITTFA